MDRRASQAERIARALYGRRVGVDWMVRCVCHDENTPSLALRDGTLGGLLVHCFGQRCDPVDILRELRRRRLLDDDRPDRDRRPPVAIKTSDRGRLALDIWNQCELLAGTLGEVHLAKRGLALPPGAEMRFHPRCPREREKQPAIVWLLRCVFTNQPRAIQRRFLLPDGTKDGPARTLGPSVGTVWKLSHDEDVTTGLGLAEGYADGLLIVNKGWSPVWVLSGTGTLMAFPVLARHRIADDLQGCRQRRQHGGRCLRRSMARSRARGRHRAAALRQGLRRHGGGVVSGDDFMGHADGADRSAEKSSDKTGGGNGTSGGGQGTARQPSHPNLITGAEFRAEFKPMQFVIEGMLPPGSLTTLTAMGNVGKTPLLMLMCACIITGQPFDGRKVKQGNVLYVQGENVVDFRRRYIAMHDHFPGFRENEQRFYIYRPTGGPDLAEMMAEAEPSPRRPASSSPSSPSTRSRHGRRRTTTRSTTPIRLPTPKCCAGCARCPALRLSWSQHTRPSGQPRRSTAARAVASALRTRPTTTGPCGKRAIWSRSHGPGCACSTGSRSASA